jgi:gamma-glutamyltranspeptidase/glutathione hydrolase
LIALNIAEGFDLAGQEPLGVDRLHVLVESMRLAFADTAWYVADPEFGQQPVEALLSKDYAGERRALINRRRATVDPARGAPLGGSETAYLTVVDGAGNACSFINSLYVGFGTGIVPEGTGISLQNRGHLFSLDPQHPNSLAPHKRPYHTIIPALATTNDGALYASFGVMGGYMQPQGHLQVVVAMVDDGADPQAALDRPRFCLTTPQAGSKLELEDGIPAEVGEGLRGMGHDVATVSGWARSTFGRGQIICRNPETEALIGGSDARADGAAVGW